MRWQHDIVTTSILDLLLFTQGLCSIATITVGELNILCTTRTRGMVGDKLPPPPLNTREVHLACW